MPRTNKQGPRALKEIPLRHRPSKNWFSNIPFPLEEKKLTSWETACTYLIFAAIFLLYCLTLAPSVPTGDSGELITSAFTLGISHPPGYPLFNIIGKLFSYIPFGSIAWRINLSSAVFNVLASIFIYLTLFKLIKYWPAALLAAVFFATSPIIWEYSLKAEVFAINNFLAALILYLIVCSRALWLQNQAQLLAFRLYQAKSRRILYATLFVCGLALTDHQTIILFAPSVLLALFFYQGNNLKKPATVSIALGAFIMGLAVLLYIPMRAKTHPYMNWDNPETLDSFLTLVLRKDYGSLKFMNLEGETYSLIEKYSIYCFSLIKQFTPVGVFLAILGAYFALGQKDKKLGVIFLLAFLLSSFFFIYLANIIRSDPIFAYIFQRFYMLPSIVVALFIGLGIYYGHQLILRHSPENRKKISSYLMNSFLALIILITTGINYSKVDQRKINFDYYLGYNILNSLEKNAIFITGGDVITNSLLYLQRVENMRTDVTVIDTAMLTYYWHCNQLKREHPTVIIPSDCYSSKDMDLLQLIGLNQETHPIYVNAYFNTPRLEEHYQRVTMGIVKKIIKKEIPVNKDDYLQKNTQLWQSYNLVDVMRTHHLGSHERQLSFIYATSYFELGFEYQKMELFDAALHAYNQTIYLNKINKINELTLAPAYKNSAIIYFNTKHQMKQAIDYFKQYITLVPDDADKNMILSLINQHDIAS